MPNLNEILSEIRENNITLLGICPMSELVVQAALEESRDYDFPAMFPATFNQVDVDGGYTGWTSKALVRRTTQIAENIGYKGPVIFARDHGGPWIRDIQKNIEDERTALEYVSHSLDADIDAGFGILHIDCTLGPAGEAPAFEDVIRRTVTLFEHTHKLLRSLGRSICYEVGTEEVSGGLTEPEDFERYISVLRKELHDRNISAWPVFIVGQTGTNLGLEGTGNFDPERARILVEIANQFNMGIKQHFTDDMPDETLRMFPKVGIAAANVGPEFAAAETRAYIELAKKEQALRPRNASNFLQILEPAVLTDGHWKRWLKKPESTLTEKDKFDIAVVCGRYVYRNPAVAASLKTLFENLEEADVDPKRYVIDTIRKAINRYVVAFKLEGANAYF